MCLEDVRQQRAPFLVALQARTSDYIGESVGAQQPLLPFEQKEQRLVPPEQRPLVGRVGIGRVICAGERWGVHDAEVERAVQRLDE